MCVCVCVCVRNCAFGYFLPFSDCVSSLVYFHFFFFSYSMYDA